MINIVVGESKTIEFFEGREVSAVRDVRTDEGAFTVQRLNVECTAEFSQLCV